MKKKSLSQETRAAVEKAEKFFYEHAGSGYNPSKETQEQGRRRGARALAEAEILAAARGWDFEWENEQHYSLGDLGDEVSPDDISSVESCLLRDSTGKVLESLGMIQFGHNSQENRNYRRVVEAELALEAIG